MEQEKILFISNRSSLAEKFSNVIATEFQLEQRKFTTRSLYKELFDVSVIVIYTNEISKEQYEMIYTFLTVMPETFIPVVLFGTPLERKAFKQHVNYPIQMDIDSGNERLKLCNTLHEFLKKFSPAPKEDFPIEIGKKAIFIMDSDITHLQKLKQILGSCYDVAIMNSSTALFRFFEQKHPNLLILGYSPKDHDACLKILSRIRENQSVLLSKLPIMLYGNQIQNAQLNDLIAYKLQAYMMSDSTDEEILSIVQQSFQKNT